MRRAIAIALAALGAACVPGAGPLMDAGRDCLGCHDGDEAPTWTVAGTAPGAGKGSRVTVTDANGWTFEVPTARNGNFYTAERVAFPLRVSVNGEAMPSPVSYGGCNRCHARGGLEDGPLMLPGEDCLPCHDGATAPPFTTAGTWGPPGRTVSISDANGKAVTLVTNAAGNFYTEEAIAFPLRVSVAGEAMPDPVTYGGCNRCHGAGGGGDD